MKDSYLSTQKKTTHKNMTNHKSQFSFATPDDLAPQKLSTMKESQFQKQNRQSQNYYIKLSRINYTHEDMESLANEHRVEVEKLLLEISRLHDVIYDLERGKKHEIQRLKEEYEHMTLLHMNNLKNSQISQVEILQTEIRKLKQSLKQKTQQCTEIEKKFERKIQKYQKQNETLQKNVRQLIDRKNEEMFFMEENNQRQLRKIKEQKQVSLNQVKNLCEKQMNRIKRKLSQRQEDLERVKDQWEKISQRNKSLEDQMDRERIQLEKKIFSLSQKNDSQRKQISEKFNQVLTEANNSKYQEVELLKSLYTTEVENLLEIIKVKDRENEKNTLLLEAQSLELRKISEQYNDEKKKIREQVQKIRIQDVQELESLKAKMGILHQNDLQSLVKVYESKINGLSAELEMVQDDLMRTRSFLHEESQRSYEIKKNSDVLISKLNVEILSLRGSLNTLEQEMKEKVEKQRSILQLTNQNLIGDRQYKIKNMTFHEQQLRKLRQIIDNLNGKISKLQEEKQEERNQYEAKLKKMQLKMQQLDKQKDESQINFRSIIDEKNVEIKQLNKTLNQFSSPVQEQNKQITQIQRLQQIIQERESKLKELEIKYHEIEKIVLDLETENTKIRKQNEIFQEQLKRDFQNNQLEQIYQTKKFYQRKIEELEQDKELLQKRNTGQSQQITQLVRKYQKLENKTKEAVAQMKKRSQLESKVVELGLDENLIKNMGEVFQR